MDYELANRLKLAGFPQENAEHYYGWVEAHGAYELDNGNILAKDGVACPTLSELIKACGTGFRDLRRIGAIYLATGWNDEFIPGLPTPEEAVARLWLALNPK